MTSLIQLAHQRGAAAMHERLSKMKIDTRPREITAEQIAEMHKGLEDSVERIQRELGLKAMALSGLAAISHYKSANRNMATAICAAYPEIYCSAGENYGQLRLYLSDSCPYAKQGRWEIRFEKNTSVADVIALIEKDQGSEIELRKTQAQLRRFTYLIEAECRLRKMIQAFEQERRDIGIEVFGAHQEYGHYYHDSVRKYLTSLTAQG